MFGRNYKLKTVVTANINYIQIVHIKKYVSKVMPGLYLPKLKLTKTKMPVKQYKSVLSFANTSPDMATNKIAVYTLKITIL